MEFKEILSRLSIPVRAKVNEEELIKLEETNFSETLINVKLAFTIVYTEEYKFCGARL
jgi:hypothetical protein